MKPLIYAALSSMTILLAACGSSNGSGLSGAYEATDVSILARRITVGESVRVDILFTTKYEADGLPDGTDLVVKVPASLTYVIGSSQIFDGSADDRDSRSPDRVVTCDNGDSYVVYNFSDADLFDREIGSFGSFGIRVEVSGRAADPLARIEAAAAAGQEFACDADFRAEADEAVEIGA